MLAGADSHATDTSIIRNTQGTGFKGCFNRQRQMQYGGASARSLKWSQDWLTVATELCRMDDGVSTELYKLETSDRVARLKALGNAIVPQVIMPIMEAIKRLNRPESD
jgi:hypothetical protein